MADYFIECITKKVPEDPYDRIAGVGGSSNRNALARQVGGSTGNNGLRQGWYLRTDTVIRMIEREGHRFFVSQGGNTVEVEVRQRKGTKYLRTKSDLDLSDNLLKLNQCALTEEMAVNALSSSWRP